MNQGPIRFNAIAAHRYGRKHSDPPGLNQWDDSNASGRVVIAIHGMAMDSATSWFTLAPLLSQSGFRVFTFDYGRHGQGWLARPRGRGDGLPGVGHTARCAEELNDFVDRVISATGAESVALVGHSFGALVAQYYLLRCDGAARVSHFVGLAPTVHGTTFNGLLRVPGAPRLGARLVGANIAEQAVGSDLLTELYRDGDTADGVHYTVISPRWDEFTTPVRAQRLEGATNLRLQGWAEHVLMLYTREALERVVAALN